MGKSKTRRKQQRNQVADDQDPDVSENEPSSSDNVSSSLNDDNTVLSNSNVMDTDIEDSEQTTRNSTPADESDPPGACGLTNGTTTSEEEPAFTMTVNGSGNGESSTNNNSTENTPLEQSSDPWLEEPQKKDKPVPPPVTVACSHTKSSSSMPGLRKALKGDVTANCSARPCKSAASLDKEIGAEEISSLSKELWICLQCGNVGCGDQSGGGGDAEAHFKTPRSDQHNIVLKLEGEMNTCWCYSCQSLIDPEKNTSTKEVIHFIKRHPKVKMSLQAKGKSGNASAPIPLGAPPPPPQPEAATEGHYTPIKSLMTKNKMNNRNKITPYSSWDNSNREEWPLGLENLGNTCFMNSALQCLSRTKSLIPKLDLYGTGNTLEIMVTADPPAVDVLGTISPDTNGDNASSLFQLRTAYTDGNFVDENGESNHTVSSNAEIETGGSSPSSSDMDSLLDVASGTSSKSSPTKELAPESYKAEIEKELKKCLRLKLVIPKDSMTSRLRHAFKTMTRSADVQSLVNGSHSSSEYFGRGRHVFTPSSIHNAMAKHFRPGQQHDSHELLRTVVDMMKKDQIKAFRIAIMQCYGLKKTEAKNCEPKIAELLKQWDRKLYHKTFVDEIFGGELVTFSKCLTCGSVRRSHEDFLDLSLPIRVYTRNHNHIPRRAYSVFDDDGDAHRSLEDCLKSFTEPEQLTGSNAVECENCHRANLAKLVAGASFEDVFPGVKPPVTTEIKKEICEPEPAIETEIDALNPSLMDEETPQTYDNATDDMDDLDEPAVDGIIGNTSDMEDEGNGVPPVFLLDETEDKQIATRTEFLIPNRDNMTLSLATTQDEGFSESESSEEKKSASISASSSRNSISEAENGTSTQQKQKENSKPIPITKCPCSRHQMVSRPPECLTVHLKRFQITSHGTSKLSDRVNFPYILNLTPFCAREDEDLQRLDGKDVYDEDGEVKYALYGIVEHSGSLHWGHYVAYIKVPGSNPAPSEERKNDDENASASSSNSNREEVTPDKWFYISDSSVSPSSMEAVLGMDPYILFYERIRGKENLNKLSQLHRLNNQSSSAPAYEVTTAEPETTTTTTSSVAGSSFDFTSYTFD